MANPYAPRAGCPLCSIVSASHPPSLATPRTSHDSRDPVSVSSPQIIWEDDNVTAYVESNCPVSSKGHIIIALNLHVPSIYAFSSADIPLLAHIQFLGIRLLRSLNPDSSSLQPRLSLNVPTSSTVPAFELAKCPESFRIGFITPPFRDSKIPIADHVHAHAFIGTPDLAGWFRGVAYSPLAWYAIDDLIAEIRESTSNNRVKSSYPSYTTARPIDLVPSAGTRSGGADGAEALVPPIPLRANKLESLSPAPTPGSSGASDEDPFVDGYENVDLGSPFVNQHRFGDSRVARRASQTYPSVAEGEAGPGPSSSGRMDTKARDPSLLPI